MFALYKEGDTHVVDGVKCEIIRVELNELDDYRSKGWVDDITSLYIEKTEQPKKTK